MAGPDEVMTIEELADYLKISKSTLYKLVQDGGMPGQKVGKRWRFHKNSIDEWLKGHPARSDSKTRAAPPICLQSRNRVL